MKKCIFLSLIITLFFSVNIYADNAYDDGWISKAGSCVWTDEENPLVGWGTIRYQGVNYDPQYGIYSNISKGVTVLKNDSNHPGQGTVYIFSDTNSGAWKSYNRINGWPPTLDNVNWSTAFNNISGFNEIFGTFSYPVYYSTIGAGGAAGSISINNCDFTIDTWQDLYDQLEELNWDPSSDPSSNIYDGDLPFLSYSLDRHIVPKISNGSLTTVKLDLLWDYTEKEPYKSNPTAYTFDIDAWANFKSSPNGVGEIWDSDNLNTNVNNLVTLSLGGSNISVNNYSWLYDDIGTAIYNKAGKEWKDDSINALSLGYIVAIRTRSVSSEGQAYKTSWWKLFKAQAGGYLVSTGKCINDNGDVVDAPTGDGAENSNDDISTSSGGIANYSPDNNNSASSDPTGNVYDEASQVSISSLISNLKEMLNGLIQITDMMHVLFSTMPQWLITLIYTSIGLLVIVGVVKTIIG